MTNRTIRIWSGCLVLAIALGTAGYVAAAGAKPAKK